jgi:autotransporter-associated beta strand protein
LVFSGNIDYADSGVPAIQGSFTPSNNDIQGLTVDSIQFTEKVLIALGTPVAGGYDLTGNPITLVGLTSVSDQSRVELVNTDTGQTVETDPESDSISLPLIEKPILITPPFAIAHTYEVDSGNTLFISGAVTAVQLIEEFHKTGDGEVDLTNPGNNFHDDVVVDAGVLRLGSVPAIRSISGSGEVDTSGSLTIGSLSGIVSIRGVNQSDTVTFGTDNTDRDYSGVISGPISVIKAGTGNCTLGGANSFTGSLRIQAGTLTGFARIPSVAVTVDAGATLDLDVFDAQISSLSGAGTVRGGNESFSVTLTTGADNTSTTFTGDIESGINLVKVGTGTFTLGGANGFVGNLTVKAGTLAQGADNAVPETDVEVDKGATFDLHTYNVNIRTLTGAGTVTSHGSCTLTVGAGTLGGFFFDSWSFDGDISGDIALVKTGGATFTLNAINDFNGGGIGLTIMSGAVAVGTNDAIPFTVTVNVEADGRLDLRGHKDVLGSLTGAGTIDSTDGAEPVFFAKPVPGTLTVGANNASSTWSGDITGSIALDKVGTGKFKLAAVNDYALGTTVEAGILAQGVADAIPGGQWTVSPGATINLNGNAGNPHSLSGPPGSVVTSATDPTLTIGAANSSSTFAGVISGPISLVKVGTGTFTLAGANTYTGTTTVLAGTLNVTGSLSPSSVISVAPGAMLTGTASLANVTVNGTGGNDIFVIDTTGVTLNGTPIVSSPYTNLTVNGGSGNDTFYVRGTNAITINANGADAVIIGDTGHNLAAIGNLAQAGFVTVNGNGRTTVEVDDRGNSVVPPGYSLYNPLRTQFTIDQDSTQVRGQLTRVAQADVSFAGTTTTAFFSMIVDYGGLASLTVDGGPAVVVTPTPYYVRNTAGIINPPGTAAVTINANGTDAVVIGDANNTINGIQGAVSVIGNGNTTLEVNDSGSTVSQDYRVYATSIHRVDPVSFADNMAPISYQNVGNVVLDMGSAQSGLNLGSIQDDAIVFGTAAATTTSINGGLTGEDLFTIAPFDNPGDQIQGPVRCYGGNGLNPFAYYDYLNPSPTTYTLTAGQVQVGNAAPVTYDSKISQQVTIYTAAVGGNQVVVLGTSAPTGIAANNGDVITLANPANILSNLLIGGNPPPQSVTVFVNDLSDTATGRQVTFSNDGYAWGIGGLSPGHIYFGLGSGSSINVLGGSPATGQSGGNTYSIQSVPSAVSLMLNTGTGGDTVNVGSTANTLDPIQGTLSVVGAGGNTTLNLYDQGTGSAQVYTLSSTQFTRAPASAPGNPTQTINYFNINHVYVHGGTASDTWYANSTLAGTSTDLISGNGLPAGLVSVWKGDGNANDFLSRNNGTLQPGVTFAPGVTGATGDQAFSFNGSNGLVDLGHDPSLNVSGSLTVSAWVNVQSLNHPKYLFADFDPTGHLSQGSLGILATGQFFWFQGNEGVTNGFVEPFGATHVNLNQWYHVAVARDDNAKTITLYVNGVQDGSVSYAGIPVLPLQGDKLLGGSGPGFLRDSFSGLLDEVALFNRALSAAEIQNIYNSRAFGGGDTVNVGSAGNTLDPIQGALTVNGQGNSTLNFNDLSGNPAAGYDYELSQNSFSRTATAATTFSGIATLNLHAANKNVNGPGENQLTVASTAPGTTYNVYGGTGFNQFVVGDTLNGIQGALFLHGSGNGFTAVSIYDIFDQSPQTFLLTAGPTSQSGMVQRFDAVSNQADMAAISYDGITGGGSAALETANAYSSAGLNGDTVNVQGNAADLLTRVLVGTGDTVTVGNPAHTMSGILGDLRIQEALAPEKPTVVLDDAGDTTSRSIDLANDGGHGYRITGLLPTSSPGRGNVWLLFSLAAPVSLKTGTGDDVFRVHDFTGAPAISIVAEPATSTRTNQHNKLDYSAYTGTVQVVLPLGMATGFAKVIGIQDVTAGIGDSLLVGDKNPNILVGGTGRNILIGGGGGDTLDAHLSAGDNILIGGYTQYDQKLAALEAIMTEWLRTDLSFSQRLSLIQNGGDPNEPYLLNSSSVFDDGGADVLTGGAGRNWFFVHKTNDVITNFKKGSDHTTPI